MTAGSQKLEIADLRRFGRSGTTFPTFWSVEAGWERLRAKARLNCVDVRDTDKSRAGELKATAMEENPGTAKGKKRKGLGGM